MDSRVFLGAKELDPSAAHHIEAVIDYLIAMGCVISNMRKPWRDNNMGRAASALAYALPSAHPRHPNNGGIWNGLDT